MRCVGGEQDPSPRRGGRGPGGPSPGWGSGGSAAGASLRRRLHPAPDLSRDSPLRRPCGLRGPRSRLTAAPALRPALGSLRGRAPPPPLHCRFPLPVPAPPRSPSPALGARRGREPRAASAAGPAAGPAHLQRRAGPAGVSPPLPHSCPCLSTPAARSQSHTRVHTHAHTDPRY